MMDADGHPVFAAHSSAIFRRPSAVTHVTELLREDAHAHIEDTSARNAVGQRPISVALEEGIVNSSDDSIMTGFPARQSAGSYTMLRRASAIMETDEGDDSDDGKENDADNKASRNALASGEGDSAARTIDEHVANRVARARRNSRKYHWCARAHAWFLTHVVYTWATMSAVIIVAIGIVLQFAAPWALIGTNVAYAWMYLIGGSIAAIQPVMLVEDLVYRVAARCSSRSLFLREAADFAGAARGILPYLAAVLVAIVLESTLGIILEPDLQFYYTATMASMLVVLIGLIIKGAMLKATLRYLYRVKHMKAVRDVIFYEEIARCVTSPLSTSSHKQQHSRARNARQPVQSGEDAGSAGSLEKTASGVRKRSPSGATGGSVSDKNGRVSARGIGRSGDINDLDATPVEDDNTTDDGGADGADVIRRSSTPTIVLETNTFWGQAAYVSRTGFTMSDSEGFICVMDSAAAVEELGEEAFTRLYRAREARRGMRRAAAAARAATRVPTPHPQARTPVAGAVNRLITALTSTGRATTRSDGRASAARALHSDTFTQGDGDSSTALREAQTSPPLRKPPPSHVDVVVHQAATTLTAAVGIASVRHIPSVDGPGSSSGPVARAEWGDFAASENVATEVDLIGAEPSDDVGPTLRQADLSPCFTSRGDLEAAFSLLDLDGDGKVNR